MVADLSITVVVQLRTLRELVLVANGISKVIAPFGENIGRQWSIISIIHFRDTFIEVF